MRRFIGIFIVAAAMIAVLFFARRGGELAGAASTPELPSYLPVATNVIHGVDRYVVDRAYTGEIVARRSGDLGFERDGKIDSVFVREGAQLAEGDPIALLDSRRIEEKLREMEAAEREARAVLAELTAGPRSQELQAAVERVNELKAQLVYAQSSHKRAETLLTKQIGSVDNVEEARAKVEQLESALAAARQELGQLNEGARHEQVDAQIARVDQIVSQKHQIAIEISDSTLRAPFPGRVAKRYRDEGGVVQAGEPIVHLVDDGHLTAWIGMPVDSAQRFAAGTAVTVTAGGRNVAGTVSSLLPTLHETTRAMTVIVDLDEDAARGLVPGQVASLAVPQEVPGPGFWLPSGALLRGVRGTWVCLAVGETKDVEGASADIKNIGLLELRDVEVLHAEEDKVFVQGALKDGDRVVADGTHRVVQGQWVGLLDERGPRVGQG